MAKIGRAANKESPKIVYPRKKIVRTWKYFTHAHTCVAKHIVSTNEKARKKKYSKQKRNEQPRKTLKHTHLNSNTFMCGCVGFTQALPTFIFNFTILNIFFCLLVFLSPHNLYCRYRRCFWFGFHFCSWICCCCFSAIHLRVARLFVLKRTPIACKTQLLNFHTSEMLPIRWFHLPCPNLAYG